MTYLVKAKSHEPFPMDMLRYDQAYPASERDALRIESSVMTQGEVASVPIELVSRMKPTVDRWDSFGWEVLP